MRRWYVLTMLVLIGSMQQLDRQVLSILFEPIKHEFHLSDTQLGFLSGVCYAIPYALAGIPLGALIDRVNRRNFVAILLLTWSALTSVSGFARSSFDLAIARIGVAAAESANTPLSYTLICDYFAHNARRATALGLYMIYNPMGTLLGFVIGGAVAAVYGWRMAFFVAGVPGAILAVLFLLTVREPQRRATDDSLTDTPEPPPSFKATLRFVFSQRSLLCLYGSMIMAAVVASGALAWLSSFYVRVFGLSVKDAGLVIGVFFGLAGGFGGPIGGLVADRVGRKNILRVPLVAMVAVILMLLAIVGLVVVPWLPLSVALMSVAAICLFAQWGPGLSLGQKLVGTRMRGVAGSLLTVGTNFFAAVVGAQLVGILSDLYIPWAGNESLRFAILSLAALGLLSIAGYSVALRTLRTDLERAAQIA